MLNMNLLDWRGRIRRQNNNKFFAITGAACIISMILASSSILVIDIMIGHREKDVAYLASQLKTVEGNIQKIKSLEDQRDLILKRREVIEGLQGSRPFVVRLFDNLARVVPDGVVIDTMQRVGDKLQLTGNSVSNGQISILMKNIEQLDWVKSSTLAGITTAAASDNSNNNKNNNGTANAAVNENIGFQLNLVLQSVDSGDENDNEKK